jgi:hypothetical protein
MTKEERAYADALNTFGSDPEDASEHEILHHMHDLAHPGVLAPVRYTLSTDSGRGPARTHIVRAHWTDADGTSRSREIAATGDAKHAHRILAALTAPKPSVNWPAVYAAVAARGPRCDRCGNWTFRPGYLMAPRTLRRLCPDCAPGVRSFLEWITR